MVERRMSKGAMKPTLGSAIENKHTSGRSNNTVVSWNHSVTENISLLTVEENQFITNMVDENEQSSSVFHPTGASSSTVSLTVQAPASKQQQNQRQGNPNNDIVKHDVVDLTERRRK